ncbi:hypothetical protein E2C01_024453 [Portunus trituberculatus]|uniref:Uncharacterized protein n=1 Tax=Portunus trituberculatus TaxID=210409 RepID=A0A5B7EAP2_PORTR|nr:hypothetical protein [Portunus trituberculatus]
MASEQFRHSLESSDGEAQPPIKALAKEKVSRDSVSLSDSDTSDNVEPDVDDVTHPAQGLIGGSVYPTLVQASHVASQVNLGASTSTEGDFLGFPVPSDHHMVVGRKLGTAFDVDDAIDPAVTEVLAKDIREFLHMVPDDQKTRLLAEQWSFLSNLKELRVPESDSLALFTHDPQSCKMESKLAHTNSLPGKALIPLIKVVDSLANSDIPAMVKVKRNSTSFRKGFRDSRNNPNCGGFWGRKVEDEIPIIPIHKWDKGASELVCDDQHRHGGGSKVAVTVTATVRVVNSTSAPTWALPPLLNGSRVVLQPAPKWVTGCGKAFLLQKDHRKKAAKLVGVGCLVSMKSTQQLEV